CVRL
ncbi:hypothetical protein ECEC1848_5640, partial [Escherichia coli EC1848]